MKTIIAAVTVAILLMVGAFMLSTAGSSISSGGNGSGPSANGGVGADGNTNNVSVIDGKQIIEINVKGGYNPGKSIAKAGIPTIIRFKTNGSFDCSSSIRIPSLNISQSLPQTGNTDIDVGTQSAGVLNGTCGMGMYRFEVDFRV